MKYGDDGMDGLCLYFSLKLFLFFWLCEKSAYFYGGWQVEPLVA